MVPIAATTPYKATFDPLNMAYGEITGPAAIW
jgi:hypothetical protein